MIDGPRPWYVRYQWLLAVIAVYGLIAVVVLVQQLRETFTSDSRLHPARQAVERYLDTLLIPDFPAAYDQLCWADRHSVSEQEFVSWGSQPRTGVLDVVDDQGAWRVCPA